MLWLVGTKIGSPPPADWKINRTTQTRRQQQACQQCETEKSRLDSPIPYVCRCDGNKHSAQFCRGDFQMNSIFSVQRLTPALSEIERWTLTLIASNNDAPPPDKASDPSNYLDESVVTGSSCALTACHLPSRYAKTSVNRVLRLPCSLVSITAPFTIPASP